VGSVVRVDIEEDRPSDDSDSKDGHDGDTSSLEAIGVGGDEKHEYESDNVGRYSVELSVGVAVSETFDDSREETTDGTTV
jgi:hypothetical protein